MRRLFAFALLFGLALAQKGYYPHALGMRWVYTSGEVQAFTEVRELGGVEVWMLEHRYKDGGHMTEALSYDAQGVWVLAVVSGGATFAYDPPLKLYPPPPLRAGISWTSESKLRGQPIRVEAKVLGLSGVEVKAGRFNAFKIRSRLTASGGSVSVVDLYFVPGVGVVRYATPDGGVIDLVSFSR